MRKKSCVRFFTFLLCVIVFFEMGICPGSALVSFSNPHYLRHATALEPESLRLHQGLFESFEEGFGVWEPDASTPLPWFVTRTEEKAHTGTWSINMTADGHFDDGTVWIVREICIPEGTWTLGVDFFFWSEGSQFNNWEVFAYIGLLRPEIEADFTCIGHAGIQGWSPYNYSTTIQVDHDTTGWVAIGINIVWETWRTHYFDSVTITGLPQIHQKNWWE